MADAAFITECIDAYENGIVSSSPKSLRNLYVQYDEGFPQKAHYRVMLDETFQFIIENFGSLRDSFIMKPYALHSLVTALLHNRYGMGSIEMEWGVRSTGRFCVAPQNVEQRLLELAQAHEAKEDDGPHGTYVWGCMSTTDRKVRRTARVAAILRALDVDVPDNVDANLA